MNTSAQRWYWKLGLTSFLALGGSLSLTAFLENLAVAQIAPDDTLGAESSVVTPSVVNDIPSNQIDGGAIRGTNLFHSFEEFNIYEGRGAFFTNPVGVENILSRVTGNNPSNILGKLGVLGDANLFLINPNGIIFGATASLDVRSSFVATTANATRFGNQGFFSASTPNQPELLTVNPSAFFFNQIAAKSITNQSTAGLQVPAGQSLLLVGGDVRLESGRLTAAGGRVELGGLASSGTVELNFEQNNLLLSFPLGVPRSNVSLINGALVDVTAGGGGSIAVNAQNLDILAGSSLLAGIGAGLGSVGTQAGNIEIEATEQVSISGTSPTGSASRISSIVNDGAIGNAGNVVINTNSLDVTDGAVLGSILLGQGNAGSVTIQARNAISFARSSSSGITSGVGSSGVGNGGDVNLQTRALSLSDGAQLITSTLGQGDAGNIQINATDSVSFSGGSGLLAPTSGQGNAGDVTITASGAISFDGVGVNGLPSGVNSEVLEVVGNGLGGNIKIRAGSLSLTNGARLSSSTSGQGNAGDIIINADNTVSFDSSSAASNVSFRAVGRRKGGNINIQARSLSFNNAALISSTFGQGDAGNIQINATDSVSFSGSSTLRTQTAGQGNAGDVIITAGDVVSFDGQGAGFPSGIISIVERPQIVSSRKAGNINIQARSLSFNNAILLSSTLGQGDAGSISVQASDSVSLANSFIASTVGEPGVGNGGDINIQTRSLSLIDGSQVQALTRGKGNAGNIWVNAIDSINLSGVGLSGFSISENRLESGLFTSTEATASGQGGEIRVATGALRVSDGAVLSARTRNTADGGNIFVNANTLEAFNGGQILTTAFSSGRAGDIFINATNSVTLSGSNPTFFNRLAQSDPEIFASDGSASGLFARTQATGSAGNLTVNTRQLQVLDQAEVTVSGELGRAGNLSVTADAILIDQGKLTAVTGLGEGGDITLSGLDLLQMRDNSLISAEALNNANGGNINVDADLIVAVPQENSDIIANASQGRGGNINIEASGIFGLQYRDRPIPTTSDINASSEFGVDGAVEIDTPDLDPSRGLVSLPTVPVDPEVAQACTPGGSQVQSEFVVTGRGGLPANPNEVLSSDAISVDWLTLNPEIEDKSIRDISINPTASEPDMLVEAQAWAVGNNGEIVLTASAPTAIPHRQTSSDCLAPKT